MTQKSKRTNIFGTTAIMAQTIWVTLCVCSTVLIKNLFNRCTRNDVDRLERKWADKILQYVKLNCRIENPHHFKFNPERNYIIMSNHASHYDIPLIIKAFPGCSIRMIAKKELFKIPIWGQAIRKAEFIPIDRNNRKQAFKDLDLAKDKMDTGIVIWIAPEGTRTRTGKIQQFKNGGFKMALQTNALIVPVGIRGSFDVLPPDTWHFSVGNVVTVHIGQPIDATQYNRMTRKQMVREVEKSINLAVDPNYQEQNVPKAKPPVITIDGPSGTGKGTLCQLLAEHLGWHILDSGAIYRLLALAVNQGNIPIDDEDEISRLATHLNIDFVIDEKHRIRSILNDIDVTDEIRTEQCGNIASKISKFPKVRAALLERQRAFQQWPGLVTDGRDMGTVVFPQAELKLFLDAGREERAKRRHNQLIEKGINVSLAQILTDLEERDHRDQSRAACPLIPAQDALTLDTTKLDINEVFQWVKSKVEE